MAKSKETFGKKEKEKKRLKQQQDKREKMEARKANAKKGRSLDEMMAYVDENGNLSSTPPDPRHKKVFRQDSIKIGVPQQHKEEGDTLRKGIVSFFNYAKGFGFIKDEETHESVFVHVNELSEPIKENDHVSFKAERGPKGLSAVHVKKSS